MRVASPTGTLWTGRCKLRLGGQGRGAFVDKHRSAHATGDACVHADRDRNPVSDRYPPRSAGQHAHLRQLLFLWPPTAPTPSMAHRPAAPVQGRCRSCCSTTSWPASRLAARAQPPTPNSMCLAPACRMGCFSTSRPRSGAIPSSWISCSPGTANLAAGDSAFFDLAGVVVAQAIPEPGVLALAAIGLIGLAATRRRKGLARRVA